MAKVHIVSSTLVKMATNEATAISRIELTPWDLQFLLLDPIQKGILFHKPSHSQSQQLVQNTNIIHHLKNSFSRTLDFFPPLAGRLGTLVYNDNNTTCFFLDCNNVGAEFTHAVAEHVFVSNISESKYIPEIMSSFFPLNGVPNFQGISKPLLGVQITELEDGLFIGFTANHVVVDGTSFWHFINSWSEISRGFHIISKPPVFERDFAKWENRAIPLITPLDQHLVPNYFVRPPLLERVFQFSKESVAKLKARANSEAGSENKISSLQAVSAHLWRSVVRCQHLRNIRGQQEAYNFSLVVGTRARIPLPEGYFGNGAFIVGTTIDECEVMHNELGFAGVKINELVNQQSREEIIKFVEDWVKNPKIFKRGSLNSFVIASSPRHNVYGSDFGWGKPIAVRSGKGQKFDGKMTTFPGSVAGGIDIEVCLAPETLRALEDDAEFMEAFTT